MSTVDEDEEVAGRLAGIVFPHLNPVIGAELMSELTSDVKVKSNKREAPKQTTSTSTSNIDRAKNDRKKKGYKPRAHVGRVPKEQSHWYRRYLEPERRNSIERGEKGEGEPQDVKLAKDFYATFRIYFELFKELVQMALTRGFHNPNKKDIMGFAHDLEILLLGSLYFLGWDTTFGYISTQSEIDTEAQRMFHHNWTASMCSIRNEYIYMPRDDDELNFVVDQYDCYGFPGCVGSIDVVQIGWNCCPSGWLPSV